MSRDKSKDGVSISSSSFLFGRTTAGRNINEFTAMQITAVYSCVRVLAETLAGLFLFAYIKKLIQTHNIVISYQIM